MTNNDFKMEQADERTELLNTIKKYLENNDGAFESEPFTFYRFKNYSDLFNNASDDELCVIVLYLQEECSLPADYAEVEEFVR